MSKRAVLFWFGMHVCGVVAVTMFLITMRQGHDMASIFFGVMAIHVAMLGSS